MSTEVYGFNYFYEHYNLQLIVVPHQNGWQAGVIVDVLASITLPDDKRAEIKEKFLNKCATFDYQGNIKVEGIDY